MAFLHFLIDQPRQSVSNHTAALCALLCSRLSSTIQRRQIKPRLITIKQRRKYYAFVPQIIIAPIPILAGSEDECMQQDYDSRHFVSLLLVLLACGPLGVKPLTAWNILWHCRSRGQVIFFRRRCHSTRRVTIIKSRLNWVRFSAEPASTVGWLQKGDQKK